MELHFCSVCGISIPLTEVESGVATGEADKKLCSEHRPAQAEAVPEESASTAVEEQDVELLFCANCRVSIPQSDVRAGRARKEYGSLLCGVCAKAKPGERAARREAVEAEMAADVDSADPVGARRCSVCSAVVPHGHIVTGKARMTGDRVVCEGCQAAAHAEPIGAGSGMKTAMLFVLVALIAGGVAFAGVSLLSPKKTGPDPELARAGLRSDLEQQISALKVDRDAARSEMLAEVSSSTQVIRDELQSELRTLRSDIAAVRASIGDGDRAVLDRLSQAEGRVSGLSELVKGLAAQAGARPEIVVREVQLPPREPAAGDGSAGDPPVVAPPNAEVARLSKELLESGEDSVRFPAATELGRLGDPAAIPALAKALLSDKHFLVRRACARSLKTLRAWNAVPNLIQALEDKEAYVAAQANYALLDITGQDFEVTQDQSIAKRRQLSRSAKKWWDKNQGAPPDGVSLHSADLVQ